MQTGLIDWCNSRPQDIPPRAKLIDGKMPRLKIACVAIGEMGHLIPVAQIADALVQRGHEVHFITNSDDFTREKAKIFLYPIGVQVHFTDDKCDRPGLLKGKMHKFWEFPHGKIQADWQPHVYEVLEQISPDIVVSDFWCKPGTLAADKLNIPSVVNMPAPFSIPDSTGFFSMPNMRETVNCCGIIIFKRSFVQFVSYFLFAVQSSQANGNILYSQNFASRVVLSNSFLGLEEARCLPPNIHLTGPLVQPQGDLLKELKEKHNKLYQWLDDALVNNQPVVYISIGSYCIYQKWSIDALYYGLKRLGCRVIWSIKKEYKLPVENDEDIWAMPWVPQVELLSHPAVKAGVSHCGWGGTMEFIAAGVPVVCWPHFFDQFKNASLICDQNKAGKILLSRMRLSANNIEHQSYIRPEFDADYVYSIFKEVLVDRYDFYKKNMVHLQRISQNHKGRETAVRVIEQTAILGSKHAVDESLHQKRQAHYFISFQLFFFLTAALAIGNYFCITSESLSSGLSASQKQYVYQW